MICPVPQLGQVNAPPFVILSEVKDLTTCYMDDVEFLVLHEMTNRVVFKS